MQLYSSVISSQYVYYGIGDLEAKSRSNKVKREMENYRDYYHPLPTFDFNIPEGWTIIQRDNETKSYMLGHNSLAGILFATGHRISAINELITESNKGLSANGINLVVDGDLKYYDSDGIEVNYKGLYNGIQIRGYAISKIGPNGGGVTLLIMCNEDLFTYDHKAVIQKIARELKYY